MTPEWKLLSRLKGLSVPGIRPLDRVPLEVLLLPLRCLPVVLLHPVLLPRTALAPPVVPGTPVEGVFGSRSGRGGDRTSTGESGLPCDIQRKEDMV